MNEPAASGSPRRERRHRHGRPTSPGALHAPLHRRCLWLRDRSDGRLCGVCRSGAELLGERTATFGAARAAAAHVRLELARPAPQPAPPPAWNPFAWAMPQSYAPPSPYTFGGSSAIANPFTAMNPFAANPFAAWLGMFPFAANPAAWPMASMFMASGVPRSVAWPAAEANVAAMEAVDVATVTRAQGLLELPHRRRACERAAGLARGASVDARCPHAAERRGDVYERPLSAY